MEMTKENDFQIEQSSKNFLQYQSIFLKVNNEYNYYL